MGNQYQKEREATPNMFASIRGNFALARNTYTMRSTMNQLRFNNMLYRSQAHRIFSTGPTWNE